MKKSKGFNMEVGFQITYNTEDTPIKQLSVIMDQISELMRINALYYKTENEPAMRDSFSTIAAISGTISLICKMPTPEFFIKYLKSINELNKEMGVYLENYNIKNIKELLGK